MYYKQSQQSIHGIACSIKCHYSHSTTPFTTYPMFSDSRVGICKNIFEKCYFQIIFEKCYFQIVLKVLIQKKKTEIV